MPRITIKNVQREYPLNRAHYEKYEQVVLKLLYKFRSEYKNIQIFEISSRIKSIESVTNNIRIGKYSEPDSKGRKISSIKDIKDIVGLRITCHCRTDLEQIVTSLEGFLRRINATGKEFIKLSIVDHRNRSFYVESDDSFDPYQGVHFYLLKKFPEGDLTCEIQARTVLGNAWAIQSHKYMYKTQTLPGDIVTLGSAISKMYVGIEDIWEIIKTNHEENLK